MILGAENDTMLSSLRPGEMERLKMSLSKPVQVLWITFKAQLQPDNPLDGLVAGFARSLRSENDQLRLFTLDFSSSDNSLIAGIVYSLIERLEHFHKAGTPLEFEFAEKDGQLYTCRIQVDTQLESAYNCAREVQVPISELPRKPYVLSIREAGQLNTLVFVEEEKPKDELPSDLVIEVKTVGLSKQVSLSYCFRVRCLSLRRMALFPRASKQVESSEASVPASFVNVVSPANLSREIAFWHWVMVHFGQYTKHPQFAAKGYLTGFLLKCVHI